MRLKSLFLCAALLVVVLPAMAAAAMMPATFYNQTDADEIRFSVINDAIGEDVLISIRYPGDAASGWAYPPYTAPTQSVWFGGSSETDILAGTGSFTLWFGAPGTNDVLDFTLLWQEFSDGFLTFQDFDTYVDGQVATATPIPASAWMLVSGLTLFVGMRRHRADN